MQKKTIVITGASQGIGEQIALAFSSLENVRLILIARSKEHLQKVVDLCQKQIAEVHCFSCDLTDEKQFKTIGESIVTQWGAPQVLVNNAGEYATTSFEHTTVDEFKKIMDVNLTSAFIVTQAFLPSMLKENTGDIFFMCSIASIHGYADSFAYCAAKHGLLGLARTLRASTLKTGLRVTSILPGAVLTPAWKNVPTTEDQFIPASDIGKMIVDLHLLDRRTNVEELIVRPQPGDFM